MPAPVDIAPLVSAVYEPVIPVTSDTSVLTQAELTDTAVALANRIEFVRQNPGFTDVPEQHWSIVDDFSTVKVETTGFNYISSDSGLWTSEKVGNVSVSFSTPSAKNPGTLVVATPGDGVPGNVFTFQRGPSPASNLFSFTNILQMVWVVRVTSGPGNVDATVQFGISEDADGTGGGTNSLRIRCEPDQPTWILRRTKASVITQTILAAPFVSGEFVVWRLARLASGDYEIYADGVLQTTVAAADLPSGEGTLCARCSDGSTSVTPTVTDFDYVSVRADTGVRSGP